MKSRCFIIGTPLGELSIMKQFEALAHELAGRGHKVIILAPHRKWELAKANANPAVLIWPSERPTKMRDAAFFHKLVHRYKPDCVVASYAAVNIMMLVGWLSGVTDRIAWYHTLSSQINLDGHVSSWRLKLLRLRKQLIYRLSTQIVAVSQAARDDIRSVYRQPGDKLQVFLNAVADPLANVKSNGAARSVDKVVCIARLFPSKGQDVLIRALALLKDKHPQLTMELIGDGPSKGSYVRLASELGLVGKCVFAGSLCHDEVLHRMRGASLTVLPSRSDNCPLVTIESLAVGTPVVASRVGGIPEVVRDGVDGFLVPPGDPRSLAEKISLILSDGDLMQKLRANARAGFLARFEQRQAVREQADWLEAMFSNGEHALVA
ncbi:MAG TPA: glycosyltransferase family 4 protein [Verrucomicrobiae bacterium]|nr:glycosyltransferase family 4 protein [Verrucomicrobiae bacterium]